MRPRFPSIHALAALSATAIVLAVSPAAAITPITVLNIDADGIPTCEVAVPCEPDVPICPAFYDSACWSLTTGRGETSNICVAAAVVTYCCTTSDDCPSVDGMAAGCLGPTMGDPTFPHGLCAYGPAPQCFTDGRRGDATVIADCFRIAGHASAPYGTVAWRSGNCDGDTESNGTDPCPCDDPNTCVDAGVTEPDAGTTEPDAGTTDPDAGTVPFDAATMDVDAYSLPGAGLEFRGAGGFACDLGHGRDTPDGTLAALVALGGALGWRLRRRSRG